MVGNTTYKSIVKSTALFASVQVITILSRILLNKVVAILMGTTGVGVISMYNSLLLIIKSVAGMGISQSAVRDISIANTQDRISLSNIVKTTNWWLFICSIFGLVGTVVLSSFFSFLAFDNYDYSFPIMLFSIAVFFTIYGEGKLAIIKGVRNLRYLAESTAISSLLGVILSLPFYYFWEMQGIVPSLIVIAVVMFLCSIYFEGKINIPKSHVSVKEAVVQGKSMVKMGVALMYLSLVSIIIDFVVRAFIVRMDGLEQAGIYQAGSSIVLGYFGIIVTSLSTDYYPRISAIYNDDIGLNREMNRQVDVGLLLIGPMIIGVITFASFFISLLYTSAFYAAVPYTCLAAIAMLLNIPSNMMALIFFAKQDTRTLFILNTILSLIFTCSNIFGYYINGLMGLGITMIINAVVNIVIVQIVIKHKYSIIYTRQSIWILVISFVLSIISASVNLSDIDIILKYVLNSILIIVVLGLTLWQVKLISNKPTLWSAIKSILPAKK